MEQRDNIHCQLKLQASFPCEHLHPFYFAGKEKVSSSYSYTLRCLAGGVGNFDPNEWLTKPLTIGLYKNHKTIRWYHGVIKQVIIGEHSTHSQIIEFHMVPYIALLEEDHQWRIFQNKCVIDVFRDLCAEFNFHHYDISKVKRSYPSKPYWVQMKENTLMFMERIVAEAGLFYFYQHNNKGTTLILLDDVNELPCYHTEIQPISWLPFAAIPKPHGANELLAHTKATSSHCDLQVGRQFKKSTEIDTSYWIHELEFTIGSRRFAKHTQAMNFLYQNEFTCVTTKIPYQPKPAAKPKIVEHQRAVVIGPSKGMRHCDQWGRIKVKFLWQGQTAKQTSPWIPVVQPIVGQRWGSCFMPRCGEEVVVAFIAGDPERPVVIASFYNLHQRPPFAKDSCNGIRTTPESISHVLCFDDSEQQSSLSLRSAHDLSVVVGHDYSESIQGDKSETVGQDYHLSSHEGEIFINASDMHLSVGGNELSISNNDISLCGNIKLVTRASGDEKAIVRLGDPHTCPQTTMGNPHKGGNIISANSQVTNNGMAIACQDDQLSCGDGFATISEGVATITLHGKALASVDLATSHGGKLIQGSTNVTVQ